MKAPATNVGANGGRSANLLPGFGAGLLGGIAMAAWMIASAALDGMEPLSALRPMGDTFAGAEPRGGGAGVVLYGLTLHMLLAGAVGVLFTAVLPRDLEPKFASVMCIGFAFGVMAVMTSYVLPAYNPSLRAEMPKLGGSWVLAHAAYGATVGFFAQKLRHRRRAAEPEGTAERERGRAPPPGGDPRRRVADRTGRRGRDAACFARRAERELRDGVEQRARPRVRVDQVRE